MFNDIFKGKSVLVTGHTGFKGSWLALWLHEMGAKVTGLALSPHTSPSHFELIRLQELITHTAGDIRSDDFVRETVNEARPEIVFHLAAQALVMDSYDDPKTTFDINIGGTVNVLEAIRHCPSVKAVVVITSDKCYENNEWVWGYRENDPMGGHDPYSASKAAAEIVCSAYRRSYFAKCGRGFSLGFATARAGNVIGGGDWAKDRLIPDCIRALSNDKPIVVRNPNAIRPWQHTLDPLFGYLLLANRLIEDPERFSGAWNFGPLPSDQISVMELANRVVSAWGSGNIHTQAVAEHAGHEAHFLHLAIDKAIVELKWAPVLNSIEAIDWTIQWYKMWNQHDENMLSFSLKQIETYSHMVSEQSSLKIAPGHDDKIS